MPALCPSCWPVSLFLCWFRAASPGEPEMKCVVTPALLILLRSFPANRASLCLYMSWRLFFSISLFFYCFFYFSFFISDFGNIAIFKIIYQTVSMQGSFHFPSFFNLFKSFHCLG